MRTRLSIPSIFAGAVLLAGTVAHADPSEHSTDIERRYLAVDESLHSELSNLELVMGQADRRQSTIQLGDDWEVENSIIMGYVGGIIEDHNGRYRLYYEARTANGFAGAVAFSDDGVNWTKPSLNIAPHLIDHPDSNLINVEPHPSMDDGKWYENPVVTYDENAPESERYKLIWNHNSDIYVATSSDGLNFVTNHDRALNHKADTGHSFFYDEMRDEYVIYGRKRGDWPSGDTDRRGIALHSSPNWDDTPWANVGQVVADPEDVWDYSQQVTPDLYTPAAQPYHGQYVGLPPAFFRDTERTLPNRPERFTGPIYPVFMHSSDGENWRFPDPDHPIIDVEPHERVSTLPDATSHELEVGQIYTAANFLDLGDQLLIYYLAREENHYEPNPDQNGRTHHVAFLRADGFASLQATGSQEGEWLTAEVTAPADAAGLKINANVDGELRAEILDADTGEPLDGLSQGEAVPFSGDETSENVQWIGGDLQQVAGERVQIRFIIDDGEIFSFSFSEHAASFSSAAALVSTYHESGTLDRSQEARMLAHLRTADRLAGRDATRAAELALDRFEAVADGVADQAAQAQLLAVADALSKLL